MRKYIVILGPGESMPGGMLEVEHQILSADMPTIEEKRIHIPTASKDRKILTFSIAYIRLLIMCLMGRIAIAHINMSERGSIRRTHILLKLFSRFSVKSLVHSHGSELQDEYEHMLENDKIRFSESMRKAYLVVVLTKGWKEFWSGIVASNRIKVLPNGVWIPAENSKKKYKFDGTLNLLFLGYVGERKGTYDLIEAVEILVKKGLKIYLSIAGNGEVEECKKYVLEKGLNNVINVLGWTCGNDKIALLEKSDILVLPSHFESFGIVALEAMSYKLPVICGDKGYTKEIVVDGNTGFVAETGNPKSIAEKIECLNSAVLLEEFGNNGYQLVKTKYSIQAVMSELEKIYGELLHG